MTAKPVRKPDTPRFQDGGQDGGTWELTDVLYQEEAGEAFLLHVPSGRYFGLNPAGVVVWHALLEGRDPVLSLNQRWPDQELDALRADTEQVLTRFKEAGLVVRVDTPGDS